MKHDLTTTFDGEWYHHTCKVCGATHATKKPGWSAACRVICKYLGKETGELIACATCSGKVGIKVTSCHILQECTTSRVVARPGEDPLPCCAFCEKFEKWEAKDCHG